MKYLPNLHTDEQTQNYITSLIEDGGLSVAKRDTTIVGFIHIQNNHVNHLYIDRSFQNQGIGKLLLDHAKSLYLDGLELWVFEENKDAIRFYEKEGFILTEKRDIHTTSNEENLPDRRYQWKKILS
ncbi:MAG TPA: GNAT family N-acetyltransferase [Candidatus Levybacteria bacterium]|nr:GNAT family N-acetyltransferase [Candidatus Levybacteria bacterium]